MTETIQQLLIREVPELAELTIGGHCRSIQPGFCACGMAPGQANRQAGRVEVDRVEIVDRGVVEAMQKHVFVQIGG